ncbi:MAG: hypothetical protein PHD51_01105 [Patescibacteria group bacterium]|nr:hypothetical protein [Patescibacteria group bacterium]
MTLRAGRPKKFLKLKALGYKFSEGLDTYFAAFFWPLVVGQFMNGGLTLDPAPLSSAYSLKFALSRMLGGALFIFLSPAFGVVG